MAYRITRYANRKLYDPQRRRYVTLADLEKLIRAGREIKVEDARSGEDLTAMTLAQVIVEIEREGRTALPAAFLHELIKHGEAWGDFVRQSLRASLEGLVDSRREMDRVFQAWAARSGLLPEEKAAAEGSSRRATAPAPPGRMRRRAAAASPPDLSEEVAALKARLRQLERGVTRIRRAAARGPRKAKNRPRPRP